MTRLIDADALPRHGGRGGLIYSADVDKAPTVDAVPVVHGRWEQVYGRRWRCSVCYGLMYISDAHELNYCPNCGAKMDGEG